MKFHFVTLFPDTIDVWLRTSIPGRALKKGIFEYSIVPLREFGEGPHRQVDDTPYGGGGGMLLALPPLVAAWESVARTLARESFKTIYFSPAGRPLSHSLLKDLRAQAEIQHYLLFCGHYEGVDQRFVDHWVDLEISLGDFVLTGGELPALAFVDAFIRGLGGTLDSPEREKQESFSLLHPRSGTPILEYPQYTRPAEFREKKVPQVLLSGDHARIARWREHAAIEKTDRERPDLRSDRSPVPP